MKRTHSPSPPPTPYHNAYGGYAKPPPPIPNYNSAPPSKYTDVYAIVSYYLVIVHNVVYDDLLHTDLWFDIYTFNQNHIIKI